jgi:N-carbamoyl-L-amino-acid hydrolase
MHINVQRLVQRLGEVNKFGALPGGGVSRPSLSTDDKRARDWLSERMQSLGLEVYIDEIGNMFGVWKGKAETMIGTGSHLDTVPTGGYYDGALGVVAALEVFTTLKDQNYQPAHTLVLANFTNEEGTRFTPDMMGSLAYANPNQVQNLYTSKANDDGRTVLEELRRIGYEGKMKCGERAFKKFIELHIEQGPILEKEKLDIGAVEGVQAIHWKRIIIEGRSAHAGTTPIHLRKDTFYAMSCMTVHTRELCASDPGLLITVGSIQIFPNVTNVVPKKVIATVDLRHPDDAHAEKALRALVAFTKNHSSFAGLSVQWEDLVDINAVQFDATIVNAIEKSCHDLGYSSRRMVSGAGHDAQLLSSKYPSAMIFIPSRDGVSHAVDEFSSEEQIEKGANVLLKTLIALDTNR